MASDSKKPDLKKLEQQSGPQQFFGRSRSSSAASSPSSGFVGAISNKLGSKSTAISGGLPLSLPLPINNTKQPFNFITDSRDPTTLFKLNHIVGKGGFGTIWNATSLQPDSTQKTFAVKVVPFEKGEEGLNSKLKDELQLLQQCSVCPWIVRFHGSYIDVKTETNGKDLWMVMDYCDCSSLLSYMRKMRSPFTEAEIAVIMSQILQGLSFLHRLKIIHCDIKAENILWDSKGSTQIADFGEAIRLTDDLPFGKEMRGTPHFMAPEMVLGESYTTKVDIWSLGITAIELAECLPPNSKIHPIRAMQLASQPQQPPKLSNPSKFSASFIDFVNKCLAYDPKERFSSEQLLQHQFLKSLPPHPPAVLRPLAVKFLSISQNVGTSGKGGSKKENKQIVDPQTGETLQEFVERNFAWKEENNALISELSIRTRSRTRSFAFDDAFSSPSSARDTRRRSLSYAPEVKKKLDRWIILLHLAARLSSETFGVLVEDRTIKGNTYQHCFVGRECVDWIYENLRLEARDKAVQLGVSILVSGLIIPINCKDESEFDNENNVFRFDNRKIREWGENAFEDESLEPSLSASSVTSSLVLTGKGFRATSPIPTRTTSPVVSSKKRASVKLDNITNFAASVHSPLPSTFSPASSLSPTTSNSNVSLSTATAQPTTSDILTERDWKLIETGAKLVEFQPGEVVLLEDTLNRCLYRIATGGVSVEKEDQLTASTQRLATLGPGILFGEMSVLSREGKTTATIRALPELSQPTEIYVIQASFVYDLFPSEPCLCRNFYKHIALKQARRLKLCTKQQPLPPPPPSSTASTVASLSTREEVSVNTELQDSDRDKSYTTMFSLPTDEYLLQEQSCFVKNVLKEYGRLYISQNYLCFGSVVFGRRKIVIPLKEVVTVKKSDLKKKLQVKWGKKSTTFGGLVDVEGASRLVQSLQSPTRKKGSGFSHTAAQTTFMLRQQASHSFAKLASEPSYQENSLSPTDWICLCRGATPLKFRKNDLIIAEGAVSSRIYQIGKGECRVEKGGVCLGKMVSGEIFGEISFIENGSLASASVYADSRVEVFAITFDALNVCFVRSPALGGRFYKYVASIISDRLKDRERVQFFSPSSPQNPRSTTKTTTETSNEASQDTTK